ncbi:MAG: hypothetical protein RLZZ506_1610 [Bacteroidota bacterium]|jgi:hypothetical protein
MTEEFYELQRNRNASRQEQEALNATLKQNEFHFFLTLRDTRPSDKYRSFRRTDEAGIAYRDKMISRIMGVFRKCYGIRSRRGSARTSNAQYFDIAVHESGVGRSHVLTKDAAHLHIVIGFRKESPFYRDPLKHFSDFQKALKRLFPWLDCCDSLGNRGEKILIENQFSVGEYMAKPEKGLIDGAPFLKRPILWKLPSLDSIS